MSDPTQNLIVAGGGGNGAAIPHGSLTYHWGFRKIVGDKTGTCGRDQVRAKIRTNASPGDIDQTWAAAISNSIAASSLVEVWEDGAKATGVTFCACQTGFKGCNTAHTCYAGGSYTYWRACPGCDDHGSELVLAYTGFENVEQSSCQNYDIPWMGYHGGTDFTTGAHCEGACCCILYWAQHFPWGAAGGICPCTHGQTGAASHTNAQFWYDVKESRHYRCSNCGKLDITGGTGYISANSINSGASTKVITRDSNNPCCIVYNSATLFTWSGCATGEFENASPYCTRLSFCPADNGSGREIMYVHEWFDPQMAPDSATFTMVNTCVNAQMHWANSGQGNHTNIGDGDSHNQTIMGSFSACDDRDSCNTNLFTRIPGGCATQDYQVRDVYFRVAVNTGTAETFQLREGCPVDNLLAVTICACSTGYFENTCSFVLEKGSTDCETTGLKWSSTTSISACTNLSITIAGFSYEQECVTPPCPSGPGGYDLRHMPRGTMRGVMRGVMTLDLMEDWATNDLWEEHQEFTPVPVTHEAEPVRGWVTV